MSRMVTWLHLSDIHLRQEERDKAISAFCVVLRRRLAATLDDLARVINDERIRIAETMPLPKRIGLAKRYLEALGVDMTDLHSG